MLLLVWSRGVVFTAFITSRFSRTVKGKVMVLMMIMTVEPAAHKSSASLSVMFEAFVKLAKEKFAMSNWKLRRLSSHEIGER